MTLRDKLISLKKIVDEELPKIVSNLIAEEQVNKKMEPPNKDGDPIKFVGVSGEVAKENALKKIEPILEKINKFLDAITINRTAKAKLPKPIKSPKPKIRKVRVSKSPQSIDRKFYVPLKFYSAKTRNILVYGKVVRHDNTESDFNEIKDSNKYNQETLSVEFESNSDCCTYCTTLSLLDQSRLVEKFRNADSFFYFSHPNCICKLKVEIEDLDGNPHMFIFEGGNRIESGT